MNLLLHCILSYLENYVILLPLFIGNVDVSKWVINSRVGHKTNKQTMLGEYIWAGVREKGVLWHNVIISRKRHKRHEYYATSAFYDAPFFSWSKVIMLSKYMLHVPDTQYLWSKLIYDCCFVLKMFISQKCLHVYYFIILSIYSLRNQIGEHTLWIKFYPSLTW